MKTKTLRTVCTRDCYDTCSLLIQTDESGQIVSIKGDPAHPITQGFLCPRGQKDYEHTLRNRVLQPSIRTEGKPGQTFQTASWNDALTLVVEKLQQTLNTHGPAAVLHLDYAGNTGWLTWWFPRRLWKALGVTQTDYSICSKSGHAALALHFGGSYGLQPDDLPKQRLIIYWGFNAPASSPHRWALSQKARRQNDALIAVVDPRESTLAKNADLWLRPKPGSDVVLAYGIALYLIEHHHVDLDFITQWTQGFDQLKTEVMNWTPKRVQTFTGVTWDLIKQLGEAYAKLTPSTTMIGLGLQQSHQGAEAVRAIAFLPSLVGLHRGFFYSNGRDTYPLNLSYLTGENLAQLKQRTVSQVGLSRFVKEGDFKFIFIYNMNPALTLPNQPAFRSGLSRDDVFVVVHETHWTETTDYADVVLPAPTYWEKDDLVIPWGHRYVRLSRKIIEPRGESKAEIWLMQQLAKKLGLREAWLFEDPWEAVAVALEGALENGTFEDLMQGQALMLKPNPPDEYPTPSGKLEFYSSKAEELGLSPLPVQHPLTVNKNEFILLTSSVPNYTHTQFREVYGPIPSIVEIHPKDAQRLVITTDDIVTLYNEQGRMQVKAVISGRVPQGVVWSPKHAVGLKGEPQNNLTPSIPQTIGGGSVFNSTIVQISKG